MHGVLLAVLLSTVQPGHPAERHFRLETERGAVHVWAPRGYDAKTGALVVYVHGYFADVDEAWTEHRLADQFRSSGRNALFVVPEAPRGPKEEVRWRSFARLLAEVARAIELPAPGNRVLVFGHSGAYRTLLPWLASAKIDELFLLDALYCPVAPFLRWLDRGAQRRLVIVGRSTAARAERELAGKVIERMTSVPSDALGFTAAQRNARLVYLRSQHDHMGIVTSGQVVPVLLTMGRSAVSAR